MPSVAIFAFDDIMASGVIGPPEMLYIANIQADMAGLPAEQRFRWHLVSVDGKPVRSSVGCMLPVQHDYRQAREADIIVIPGFAHRTGREVGHYAANMPEGYIDWLQAQHARGKVLCGVCSGTFVLAEAELLDRRRATTSWWLVKVFRRRYPLVDLQPREVVTEDGNLICGGGASSWIHVCLHLIRRTMNAEVAQACARIMLADPNPASQAVHLSARHLMRRRDEAIEGVIEHMRQHLAEEQPLAALAARAAMSQRTFIRRFREVAGMPPGHYLQKMRVDAAKRLLEQSDASLEAVVEEVGYRDVSSFRRLFRKETGLSPGEFRERFRLRH